MCSWCAGAPSLGASLLLRADDSVGLVSQPVESARAGRAESDGGRRTQAEDDAQRVIVLPLERTSRRGASLPGPSRPDTPPPAPEPSESGDDEDPPPAAA
jgi:hypothetical protein